MNLQTYYLVFSLFVGLRVVDQPVGTGFSYVNSDSYLHELTEVFPFSSVLIPDGGTVLDIFGAMG
jgi:hypothetical protein